MLFFFKDNALLAYSIPQTAKTAIKPKIKSVAISMEYTMLIAVYRGSTRKG